jgi:3-dehydroquinate synthase
MDSLINHVIFDEVQSIIDRYDFFFVDKNFYNLWSENISFDESKTFFIADPEKSKNFSQLQSLSEMLLERGVGRKSKILCVGGGATSDLSGFVSAIVLRGLSWSVMPTTLLSMLDAALGGKVAINVKRGKNLIGNFHAPEHIYLCERFLETLPGDEILSGQGELVKYCFLNEEIERAVLTKSSMKQIIKLCTQYKDKVVKMDPKEANVRRLLNFGHTIGHAIESTTDLKHGHCVLLGIQSMLEIFYQDGLEKLENICDQLSIDKKSLVYPKLDQEKLWNYIIKDKKAESNVFNLAMPGRNGVIQQKVTAEDFKENVSSWIKNIKN